MKSIDFERFLKIVSNDLYSFAYVLIPDDLQASQLVVDSIQSLIMIKRNEVNELLENNSDGSVQLLSIKRILLTNVYNLARRRFQQIKLSIKTDSLNIFYELDFEEKAILFLREKLKYSLEEIALITDKTSSEVSAFLFSSRSKMETLLSEDMI